MGTMLPPLLSLGIRPPWGHKTLRRKVSMSVYFITYARLFFLLSHKRMFELISLDFLFSIIIVIFKRFH